MPLTIAEYKAVFGRAAAEQEFGAERVQCEGLWRSMEAEYSAFVGIPNNPRAALAKRLYTSFVSLKSRAEVNPQCWPDTLVTLKKLQEHIEHEYYEDDFEADPDAEQLFLKLQQRFMQLRDWVHPVLTGAPQDKQAEADAFTAELTQLTSTTPQLQWGVDRAFSMDAIQPLKDAVVVLEKLAPKIHKELLPAPQDKQEALARAKAQLAIAKGKTDVEDAGPPAVSTLTDARCLEYYQYYGSNWFTLKEELRKGGHEGWKLTPEVMWDLWLYRKKVVDGTIEELREKYPTLIAKSVGSKDLESDYDLTVATPGSGDDVAAVAEFNERIQTKMGNPPGIVFDTNLYVKDYVAVKENIREEDPNNQDTPLDSPNEFFAASDRVDQDVAAIMKQRRYMAVEDYDAYLRELTQDLSVTKATEVRQQYEEAESIFQLALGEQVERAKSHPEMAAALATWIDKTTQLESRRDVLADALAKAGSFAALTPEMKEFAEVLSKEQAEVEFGMKEALADLEHEKSALFLEMNNALYLEKMAEVRRIQDLIKSELDDPDEARIGDLRRRLEALAQRRTQAVVDHETEISALEAEEIVDEVDIQKAQTAHAEALAALDREKNEIEQLIEAISTEIPDEPRLEALKAEAKKLMGTAVFFANEAYHSEGAVEHIVAGIQGSEEEKAAALKALTPEKLVQSFNEQLGDFFKDLAHYNGKPPGEIFYRASKYLVRLLGAVDLLKQKLAGLQPTVELTLDWGDASKKSVEVGAVLYKLRKASDMDETTRCMAAVAEVERIFNVSDATGLQQSITALSIELNRKVRENLELRVSEEESQQYFHGRV